MSFLKYFQDAPKSTQIGLILVWFLLLLLILMKPINHSQNTPIRDDSTPQTETGVVFTELEQKVIAELEKNTFPDLAFLYSKEVFAILPSLLQKELTLSKTAFAKALALPDDKVTFDSVRLPGQTNYLFTLLGHLEGVRSTDEVRALMEEWRPKFVEFGNEMLYSKRYYDMHVLIKQKGGLDAEQTKIIDDSIRDFERLGINLSVEKQERIKAINQELSRLGTDFSNNILDSEKAFSYVFADDSTISAMPADILANAKELAKKDGKTGYKFDGNWSSYSQITKYCTDSKVRKHFFDSFNLFATSGSLDNRPLILDILKLRQEKAQLLGFRNHAEFSLDDKMAVDPAQVMNQEKTINEKAKIKAQKDLQEIKDYFKLDKVEEWDVSYYGNLLKEKKYMVDGKVVREYLEANNTISGMLDMANKLYGVEIKPLSVATYDPSVQAYELLKDGKLKSYLLLDLFYRSEKSSGAWSTLLREKNFKETKGNIPVVTIVTNFLKPENGPTLLSQSEAGYMLFHEFGHALHASLSESEYSELNGFNVEWDFVELPSQLMENWGKGEGLKKLAKHYQTGAPMSDELIGKINKLETFLSGIGVASGNEYSLVDMTLHTQQAPETVEALEKITQDISRQYSVFGVNPNNKMIANFSHIFVGGYDAGYYSYLWAEIIEADVFSEFKKRGLFDQQTAKKFYDTILLQGSRKPANELFKDFMGREVSLEGYYAKKGL